MSGFRSEREEVDGFHEFNEGNSFGFWLVACGDGGAVCGPDIEIV